LDEVGLVGQFELSRETHSLKVSKPEAEPVTWTKWVS